MRIPPVILITLIILGGCVATTPMRVSESAVTPTKVRPLTVALVFPETTKGFSLARNQDTGCFGTGDVKAGFGDIFTKTVTGRLSEAFQQVSVVGAASQAAASDVIVEASLSGLSFVTGCWSAPNARFTVEGSLRTLAPDGREVWRSARSKSQTAFGGLADMRTVATDLGNQIGTLADEWLQDLLNVPVATYAHAIDADPVQSAPAKSRFPDQSIDIAYVRGAERPDDIAVIIGNADYAKQGRDIPDVVPAYADAEAFKKYATMALGIRQGNIIDLRDATGSQMVEVFGSSSSHRGQLFDWVRPGQSRVHVYYAGHGAPGQDGKAYLVPADANAQRIELSGYPLDQLYRNLGQLPAKSVTVVLEACFSGNSQAGAVISNASPVFLKTKAPTIPQRLSVISAGSADQMASWEQDKSHGLFTKYYLKGMSGEADRGEFGNGDGRVDPEELKRYLADTLTYFARRYYGRDQRVQIIQDGKG